MAYMCRYKLIGFYILTVQYNLLVCEFFAVHLESHSNNYPWRRIENQLFCVDICLVFGEAIIYSTFAQLNIFKKNNIIHAPAIGCDKTSCNFNMVFKSEWHSEQSKKRTFWLLVVQIEKKILSTASILYHTASFYSTIHSL